MEMYLIFLLNKKINVETTWCDVFIQKNTYSLKWSQTFTNKTSTSRTNASTLIKYHISKKNSKSLWNQTRCSSFSQT